MACTGGLNSIFTYHSGSIISIASLRGGFSVDRGWHTPARNSIYKQLQAYHCLAELWVAAVYCINMRSKMLQCSCI